MSNSLDTQFLAKVYETFSSILNLLTVKVVSTLH